ncbi:MAG: ComF family protein, partial [Muribaculaceae bacterium]|nr:ComF family protein [Muribaculaceae bacterium]
FVCTRCLADLPRSGYHRRRLNPMEERFAGHFPFVRATGHFLYARGSGLSQLFQDMKYRRFPKIGEMLGSIVASELYPTGFFSDIDLILPMPMHFFKQMRRGYNQTHHIAAGISKVTEIPVDLSLRATRAHRTQTSLSREERLLNTSGIFSLKNPEALEGKGILLLDDVCTTGATISEAATVVTEAAPGCRLYILTIGVTF